MNAFCFSSAKMNDFFSGFFGLEVSFVFVACKIYELIDIGLFFVVRLRLFTDH